jgi:hypothetical protein
VVQSDSATEPYVDHELRWGDDAVGEQAVDEVRA